jgi:hypothetical protein
MRTTDAILLPQSLLPLSAALLRRRNPCNFPVYSQIRSPFRDKLGLEQYFIIIAAFKRRVNPQDLLLHRKSLDALR